MFFIFHLTGVRKGMEYQVREERSRECAHVTFFTEWSQEILSTVEKSRHGVYPFQISLGSQLWAVGLAHSWIHQPTVSEVWEGGHLTGCAGEPRGDGYFWGRDG